jgi:hypothetical protein
LPFREARIVALPLLEIRDRAIKFTAEVAANPNLEPANETDFIANGLSRAFSLRDRLRVAALSTELWSARPEIHGKQYRPNVADERVLRIEADERFLWIKRVLPD